jgi:hypothetical protein
LRRASSVNNFCRTTARDNFANVTRPHVAAVAATRASSKTSIFGIVKPIKDIVVQVGGANAGSRFITNTTMNSAAIM